MERITEWREFPADETEREGQIKRQILEKVAHRMGELETCVFSDSSVCTELNPDVIVISDDSSLLFELQNLRVIEWLRRQFGVNDLRVRDRIRVHPSRYQMMVSELKAAGFEVTC
jgi:hypothetical protein